MSAPGAPRLRLFEFTALLAFLAANVAFAIDAMLPALGEIAAELSPGNANRAQLVLTAFMLGLGLGTFFSGPLSDAIGRRATIGWGVGLYILGAGLGAIAQNLELLLAARFLQGIGAAGPRIASLAMVRDLYAGREMARVSSFIAMIFILVPAAAPALGQTIIGFAGWRGVFVAFVLFSATSLGWLMLRQPETLDPLRRRPFRFQSLRAGAIEVLGNREVRLYTVVMALGFGQMFALLSSAQQIFADVYAITEAFPRWFALMALLSGAGTVLNARFVMRLGMRRIVRAAYAMQVIAAALMLGVLALGALPAGVAFAAFFVWAVSLFFMAGVTFGNLNALAMQHLGHLAGMTASVVMAVSTVLAVAIAAPIGLAFNGTPLPVVLGALVASAAAWGLMGRAREI
ncbi:MFS transporter [Phaeovulum sp.]|uniref:MFS transporter n=1 Tax=Phaeovulum sp. TaxID=2934796 RepID=UPI00273161BB|nr:MFS transporter [Phaeovulum sp.]MDP1667704.1 MFS transporter [Phaeovulum sp.]MDZ4118405.1 MFS transporter [Phaeovulum sp.]